MNQLLIAIMARAWGVYCMYLTHLVDVYTICLFDLFYNSYVI